MNKTLTNDEKPSVIRYIKSVMDCPKTNALFPEAYDHLLHAINLAALHYPYTRSQIAHAAFNWFVGDDE